MTHPFLSHDGLPAWSHLTPAAAREDLPEALRRAQAALDAIAAVPAGERTFANTFVAFDAATWELGQAWALVRHLKECCDSPEIRAAYEVLDPQVSDFYAKIWLNGPLYAALRGFAETPAGSALAGADARLRDETLADFRSYGADLDEAGKARLADLEKQLAEVTRKYGENALDAANAFELLVDDPALLEGLPEGQREAALESAKAKGHGTAEKPVWRFTLQYPSIGPAMQYLVDDGLRRRLWEGQQAAGRTAPHDNAPLIGQILRLRAEKAALLGHPHFGDFATLRRMAASGAAALRFVNDLAARVRPRFVDECAELRAYKAERGAPADAPLRPWELAYLSEQLRKARHDFDDEALRPYLEVNRVIAGLFAFAEKVFGVQVRELPSAFRATPEAPLPEGAAEVWHPTVKAYELRDGERVLGRFFTDWHPRESKRSGAWMEGLMTGRPLAGGGRAPNIGVITGNLTAPTPSQPALLTHDEVLTIFHEFGHLLHHLFDAAPYRSLTGMNSAWDFIELPSQILENWCWAPEGLALFASHWQTGAPLPPELVEKLLAQRNFHSARDFMRQLAFGRMDLEMHLRPAAFIPAAEAGADALIAAINAVVADCVTPGVEPTPPPLLFRFSHLFDSPMGYAAGYYSYKWAEILEADAFSRFQRDGLFNPETGRQLRDLVLSQGNLRHPAELFRAFMGRDPDAAAALQRAGLAA